MDIVGNIFYFIVAIALLIAIHEAGHFFMARFCGVYVERFSLGFGPVLFSLRDKKGTEYSLSLIPLGGYVKMYGEKLDDSINEERLNQSFSNKKIWQRFLIVAAGPLCNILLAWLLYVVVFSVGMQDLKPVISVLPNTSAATQGFKTKDLIISINGSEVADWEEASYELISNIKDADVKIVVKENLGVGPERSLTLSLEQLELDPEKPDFLNTLGFTPYRGDVTTTIAYVMEGSAAEKLGLKIEDTIKKIDGVVINDWSEINSFFKPNPGKSVSFVVDRNGQEITLNGVVGSRTDDEGKTVGYMGIAPSVSRDDNAYFIRKYDIGEAIVKGFSKTVSMSIVTVKFMKKFVTGDISPKNISGPIGIAKGAGMTARISFVFYLSFIALISVNLGVLNLLPVPVLDGGHLFFYVVEAIRGKPLSEKIMKALLNIGLFLLLSLMALAIFNDIIFGW